MSRITRYLGPIAAEAYRITLPTKDELLDEGLIAIINRLNTRYAEKIGVEPAAIQNGHRSLVEALFVSDQTTAKQVSETD